MKPKKIIKQSSLKGKLRELFEEEYEPGYDHNTVRFKDIKTGATKQALVFETEDTYYLVVLDHGEVIPLPIEKGTADFDDIEDNDKDLDYDSEE